MKVKNLFIMSLAAFSLVACSNDEEAAIPQDGSVVIKVATAEPKTKAGDGTTTNGYNKENLINSGKVYAFLNGTTLVETKEFTAGEKTVTFDKLTQGRPYDFVAVANTDKTATTAEDFKTIEISAPTDKESFVMYEAKSIASLAAVNNFDMTIKRVLSAVQLGTVKRNQAANVPESFRTAAMKIISLALYNVNPSVNLDGSKKPGTLINATNVGAVFTEKTIAANNSELAIGAPSVAERAYACPTDGAATLYAVLEVEFEDVATKYYNIPLTAGLDANTLYLLNVEITGVGSDTPAVPDEFGSASGTITPAPWSNGSVIEITGQEN